MLNTVSEFQRTSANSVANLAYNLFGYGPAPFLYGLISNLTGDPKSKLPMGLLLYTNIIVVYLQISAFKDKLELEDS